MADRQDWEHTTAASRHLAIAADAELRRRYPGHKIEPLRSAEPVPVTDTERDGRPSGTATRIGDLAARHSSASTIRGRPWPLLVFALARCAGRPLSGGGAVHASCTAPASPCGGCHVNAFPPESPQLRAGAAEAAPRAHRARRHPVHTLRPQRSCALRLRFLLGPRPLVAVAAL